MDVVKKSYYDVTRNIIILTGLSVHHPKWLNFLLKSFTFFTMFSFICVQIAGLIKEYGNIDMVLQCVTPVCYSSMAAILYTNNNLKINAVFVKMQDDWDTLTSENEAIILHKYGRKCKIFTSIYTCRYFYLKNKLKYSENSRKIIKFLQLIVYLGHGFFYYLSHGIPMLIIIMRHDDTPKPLMFFIECGINLQKYYVVVILYSYIVGYVCSYAIVNGGTILITFLEHACGIFDILGQKLTTAIKEYPASINKISSRKKLHQEIKLCVAMHRKVLLFINDIQNAFSTSFLLFFGLSAILLSVTGVQCVMSLKNSGDACRFGCYVIFQVFNIFCLTLPTQHLLDSSLSLSTSIYNADWYHLTSETKQLLIIIMRKGSEPTTFVVGKVFVLSLQFFTKVLQTSMSYFTVLMSVRE
ncbi:odorant receptor Or2-like isoform X3 [Leptopilina boulardi]|uniref:odorant receptor Or2-like isoform X3 n=1 Tax=Leptopilina boulardi TaxID=63433 RepID=UPI0021F5796D|nr:odorant receptor Or2-like isoform X3 [Leptopilina boulardi]